MRADQINALLESDFQKYTQTLYEAVDSGTEFLNSINEFVLQKKGKELRPRLALLAARICGTPNSVSYDVAAAGQILHTATLMHDDVVDNALIRHGVPTLCAQYSSGAAVLVGDFWLSRALSLLNKSFRKEILEIFSLSVAKLSEGELIQMHKAETADTSVSDYYKIIEYKTSSLFVSCMKGGANSVNAEEAQVEAVSNYALHLGNAFQIRDDILDYTPSLDTGKPAGLDIKEKKITLPLLCAFKNNPSKEQEIRELIKRGAPEKISSEVMRFVEENGGTTLADKCLKEESRLAVEALSIFSESKEKEALTFYANYVGSREV